MRSIEVSPQAELTLLAEQNSISTSPSSTTSPTALPISPSNEHNNMELMVQAVELDHEETDSTTTEEAEERFDSPSSMDSSLLKASGTGVWGFLERVPLGLKLLGMTSCAAIGLVVLGIFLSVFVGISLTTAATNSKLLRLTTVVDEFIILLRDERAATLKYLDDPLRSAESMRLVTAAQQKVDNFYPTFSRACQDFGFTTENMNYRNIQNLIAALPADRIRILQLTLDLTPAYDTYLAIINEAAALIQRMFTSLQATGGVAYAQTTVLLEVMSMLGIFGGRILPAHRVTPTVVVGGARIRQMLVNSMLAVEGLLPGPVFQIYTKMRHEHESSFNTVLQFAQYLALYRAVPANSTFTVIPPLFGDAVDVQYFSGNFTIVAQDFETIHQRCKQYQQEETTSTLTVGIVIQVVVELLCIGFLVLTMLSAFVFSRTIAGPWLRLNRLQELTIRKFVPRPLLKLLNCSRITDVKLGISIERDITMMLITVSNFSTITQHMKAKELFQLYNKYLDSAGPIIRKHGGFIDKMLGNKMHVLISSTKKAVDAAIAIHQMMEKFNSQLNEHGEGMQLRISIHNAKVAIGTLGEHERLEGAVLSRHFDILQRMIRFAEKNDLKIVVSHTSAVNKYTRRYIGNLELLSDICQMYEVFVPSANTDTVEASPEVNKREVFTNGTKMLMRARFEEARNIFETLTKECPKDILASRYLETSIRMIAASATAQQQITVIQSMRDSTLQAAFGSFCKQEMSSENFELWRIIERYSNEPEVSKRTAIALMIAKDYLSTTGTHAVNITAEVSRSVMAKIDQSRFEKEMLMELQVEIEVVMADTHKRFKDSTLFKQAFLKSALRPRVQSVDE